jgi:hypothetical protein
VRGLDDCIGSDITQAFFPLFINDGLAYTQDGDRAHRFLLNGNFTRAGYQGLSK